MKTYTFIVNFRGGTYCSQVTADGLRSALKKWLIKFVAAKKEIKYFSDAIIPKLEKDLLEKDSAPVPLIGLKNVWFTHSLTRQGSFFVNIVQTQIS